MEDPNTYFFEKAVSPEDKKKNHDQLFDMTFSEQSPQARTKEHMIEISKAVKAYAYNMYGHYIAADYDGGTLQAHEKETIKTKYTNALNYLAFNRGRRIYYDSRYGNNIQTYTADDMQRFNKYIAEMTVFEDKQDVKPYGNADEQHRLNSPKHKTPIKAVIDKKDDIFTSPGEPIVRHVKILEHLLQANWANDAYSHKLDISRILNELLIRLQLKSVDTSDLGVNYNRWDNTSYQMKESDTVVYSNLTPESTLTIGYSVPQFPDIIKLITQSTIDKFNFDIMALMQRFRGYFCNIHIQHKATDRETTHIYWKICRYNPEYLSVIHLGYIDTQDYNLFNLVPTKDIWTNLQKTGHQTKTEASPWEKHMKIDSTRSALMYEDNLFEIHGAGLRGYLADKDGAPPVFKAQRSGTDKGWVFSFNFWHIVVSCSNYTLNQNGLTQSKNLTFYTLVHMTRDHADPNFRVFKQHQPHEGRQGGRNPMIESVRAELNTYTQSLTQQNELFRQMLAMYQVPQMGQVHRMKQRTVPRGRDWLIFGIKDYNKNGGNEEEFIYIQPAQGQREILFKKSNDFKTQIIGKYFPRLKKTHINFMDFLKKKIFDDKAKSEAVRDSRSHFPGLFVTILQEYPRGDTDFMEKNPSEELSPADDSATGHAAGSNALQEWTDLWRGFLNTTSQMISQVSVKKIYPNLGSTVLDERIQSYIIEQEEGDARKSRGHGTGRREGRSTPRPRSRSRTSASEQDREDASAARADTPPSDERRTGGGGTWGGRGGRGGAGGGGRPTQQANQTAARGGGRGGGGWRGGVRGGRGGGGGRGSQSSFQSHPYHYQPSLSQEWSDDAWESESDATQRDYTTDEGIHEMKEDIESLRRSLNQLALLQS